MSFQTVCSNCGAASGPSVGVCPFCKGIMTGSKDENASLKAFAESYQKGKLETALVYGAELYKQADYRSDDNFVVSYVKVLLETEAPTSQMSGMLAEVMLRSPGHKEAEEYTAILDARRYLKKGANDPGEVILKNVIRRSPQNVHAHFVLGAHMFWLDADSTGAISHLETCVRFHPNFLRAWACLASIYQKMGNTQLATLAFRKCAELETDPKMKEFFEKQLKAS